MKLILNIVTSAYLLSLLVMAFWTNLRPLYINHWNRTEMMTEINITSNPDLEMKTIDIVMVVNLVVVSVAGKFSFHSETIIKLTLVIWFQPFLVIYWLWLHFPTFDPNTDKSSPCFSSTPSLSFSTCLCVTFSMLFWAFLTSSMLIFTRPISTQ